MLVNLQCLDYFLEIMEVLHPKKKFSRTSQRYFTLPWSKVENGEFKVVVAIRMQLHLGLRLHILIHHAPLFPHRSDTVLFYMLNTMLRCGMATPPTYQKYRNLAHHTSYRSSVYPDYYTKGTTCPSSSSTPNRKSQLPLPIIHYYQRHQRRRQPQQIVL